MNIVVVGGSRGIGKAIATQLAGDGNQVLIVGRNRETLENTVKEIGKNASLYQADITKEVDSLALAEYVKTEFVIDGLVLSAAQFPRQETKKSVIEPDVAELSSILEANVVANYRFVKYLIPLLQKRIHPRIVIIGSTSGIRQDKGGVYGISKWALASYAYNLRDECKAYGIGVSLINPGGTFTETRVKKSGDDHSLLESSDFGILVSALFRMSPQAVMERVDIRPIAGDTY